MKDIFGRVLEFRGHKVSCKVEIVKCGEARGNKIIDVRTRPVAVAGPRIYMPDKGLYPLSAL